MNNYSDIPSFEELYQARVWRIRLALFLCGLALLTILASLANT
jgi:hypothetical protein